MCIVFRGKHANDRAALVMVVIPSLPTDLFNPLTGFLSRSSLPAMSWLKADASAEAFFFFPLCNLMKFARN